MKKQEIINELKRISKELRKSPGRREISSRLNFECIKNFGSFNNAKEKARLNITNVKNKELTENSKKLDELIVRVIAHLTFDGHLRKDLKAFYLSSKNKKELENLEKDIYDKFNIKVSRIEKEKKVLKYWYFNKPLCKFLHSINTPKGDKMITKFDVPKWVKDNKEFAREYLKMAYLCEGSKYKRSKNTEAIRFRLHKEERILDNGLKFQESLKSLLKKFNIECTKTWVSKGNENRKREGITKSITFLIKASSFNNFINRIGWYK